MAQESSPSSRFRLRVRLVSVAILVGVGALALAGCLLTRGVVADQERKLLKQRTEEPGVTPGTALGPVQTQLASRASTYASTNHSAVAFQQTADLMTKAPGGYSTVAVVKTGPSPKVVDVAGAPLTGLPAPALTAMNSAVAKAGPTGTIVATPLFD